MTQAAAHTYLCRPRWMMSLASYRTRLVSSSISAAVRRSSCSTTASPLIISATGRCRRLPTTTTTTAYYKGFDSAWSSSSSARLYSNSRYVLKDQKGGGSDDEDDEELLIIDDDGNIEIPGLPDIQTLNCDHLTDAEIMKIIEDEERRLDEEKEAKFVKDWKPGMRKRPLQMSYKLEDFNHEVFPEKYPKPWTHLDKRCGALAIKLGMMPVFDKWGIRHPCTVLFLDNNVVLGHKTMEKNGYTSVQVAAGERKRKNVSKAVLGQYKGKLFEEEDESTNPPYLIREFRVSDPVHFLPENSRIHAMHFVPGQNVDVAGITKGKGFQGPMKRWGFAGMPASHGVTKAHRKHGSIGQSTSPGRVFKGKKMAGRMGGKRVTVQNQRLIKIDRGRNLLYVFGHVPGQNGNWVEVRDSIKVPLWKSDKVPDNMDRPPLPTFEYDETLDGTGASGPEVWMPLPDKDPLSPEAYEMTA